MLQWGSGYGFLLGIRRSLVRSPLGDMLISPQNTKRWFYCQEPSFDLPPKHQTLVLLPGVFLRSPPKTPSTGSIARSVPSISPQNTKRWFYCQERSFDFPQNTKHWFYCQERSFDLPPKHQALVLLPGAFL
ncbi:hypothetical protein DPMN_024246 [Dreissena polymorpha]|uniref:Uncharacterized protein n=1 Tax=Dreissena polymorpha TaxID=45954 RepID=A0A9D4LP00_DREPO|nr:hypothetical protein DPMN_024246 [Dreissena polymorpha]